MATKRSNNYGIYRDLVDIMRSKIASKEYKEGAVIPSIREHAEMFGVNFNTVSKVWMILHMDGIFDTTTSPNSGTRVAKGAAKKCRVALERRVSDMLIDVARVAVASGVSHDAVSKQLKAKMAKKVA